ncbi:hypothetical protein J4437_03275 [Candidatus Woesearchaeota archaeon]|nr:hypothetical protein [Candidatus Woesearchaeota archaeon]
MNKVNKINQEERVYDCKPGEIAYASKGYNLFDGEVKLSSKQIVVPYLAKIYFKAELQYHIELGNAVPLNSYGSRSMFYNRNKPMSEALAKIWIFEALKLDVKPISPKHVILEELILGTKGREKIHMLEANGYAYVIDDGL